MKKGVTKGRRLELAGRARKGEVSVVVPESARIRLQILTRQLLSS